MRYLVAMTVAAMVLSATGPRLLAQAAATPPAGAVTIWTSDVCTDDPSMEAAHELKPILLVAARGGAFSGKIMVESGSPIKGLRAAAGALSGPGGAIAAENVRVRYGVDFNASSGRWNALFDAPPPEAPITDNAGRLTTPGRGRAGATVWVSVKVPRTAKTGIYTGTVTVQTEGTTPVTVPLKLEVLDWTLPDSQNFRTFMDFMQSPDTLALEYATPLWSDKHWSLIDRSFKLLSPTGGRVVYVPLICRTNLGNEQSMVRWIPKGDGKYDYDFAVVDKYLDSAEKNLGHPKLVILQVWDICMSLQSLQRGLWGGETDTKKSREELLGKGPRVTALDPKTGQATVLTLPRYEDPASKALWGPMFLELRKHLAQRGLKDRNLMLGLMPDLWPNKEEVAFWKDVSGDLAWVIHAHAGQTSDVDLDKRGLYGVSPIGYAALVNIVFNVNPAKGRMYGWRNKSLLSWFWRGGDLSSASAIEVREFPAFNITGGQNGGGRIGGDFWYVLKNKNGVRAGSVWARYPENNWRNLDIYDSFLVPGPDGPVATARLEYLLEGIQECEARIFLEDALLDAQKKAKLGADLATRCQEALDELQHAMWKTAWTDDADLETLGQVNIGRNPQESVWNALVKLKKQLPEFWSGEARTMRREESRKGQAWFRLGWQEREKKLFALAGEVAAKLTLKEL